MTCVHSAGQETGSIPGQTEAGGFAKYRRSQIAELRPYVPGEALSDRVSVSAADEEAGSPKAGDMIARNPANHDDQWLVAADYFAANFEPLEQSPVSTGEQVGVSEEPFGWSIEGSFLLCGEHVFTKSPEIRDAWSGQEAEGVTVVPLYTSAPTLHPDLLALSASSYSGGNEQ